MATIVEEEKNTVMNVVKNPWGKPQAVSSSTTTRINFRDIMQQEEDAAIATKIVSEPTLEELEEYHLKLALEASLEAGKGETEVSEEGLSDYEIALKFQQMEDESAALATAAASSSLAASTISDNDRTTDEELNFLVAQQLQEEFVREHDEYISSLEKSKNGSSSVNISYRNYRIVQEEEDRNSNGGYDDDEGEEEDVDYSKLYELSKADHHAVESLRASSQPLLPGKKDIVTKHDLLRSSRKNAKKIESFPLDFNSGNTIDDTSLRLPNKVFNSLKQYSKKNPHHNSREKSKIHDKDDVSTQERVLDPRTRLLIFKLVDSGIVESVQGVISSGKEANVYQGKFIGHILEAESTDGSSEFQDHSIHCAFKIFKTTLNEFKRREEYIKGDMRFQGRINRHNPRTFIKMWAEKEKDNLRRLAKSAIPCPNVLWYKNNVLILSLIGNEDHAAPQLRAVHSFLSATRIQDLYNQAVHLLYSMYHNARLVHADFSAYNLLYHEGQLYVIDVSQAVETVHPSAHLFLYRDCVTITKFFMNAGVQQAVSPLELFVRTINADIEPRIMQLLQKELEALPTSNNNSNDLLLLQPVIDKIVRFQRFVNQEKQYIAEHEAEQKLKLKDVDLSDVEDFYDDEEVGGDAEEEEQ